MQSTHDGTDRDLEDVGDLLVRETLDIGQQDDPEKAEKLDALVRLIGGETPYHANKIDCCGAPMLLADDQAAFSLAGTKLRQLMDWKFDALVNICPSCQKMFDNQKIASGTIGASN